MAPSHINTREESRIQSLVHDMWTVLLLKAKKEEEEKEAQRASMTEKDLDNQMRESVVKWQSKNEKPIKVDLLGMELKWTTEEQREVSLKEFQMWDIYSALRFVWSHYMKNRFGMDEDTYNNELAEVNRLVKVLHHKMRTNDTRSICIVPTCFDRETRIHFLTGEDISAIQKSPFTVLDRPRLPPYVKDCESDLDMSACSSSSEGVTTDDSF